MVPNAYILAFFITLILQSTMSGSEDELVEKLREQLLNRGLNGIGELSRTFRIWDNDGNNKLDIHEFKKGLLDYNIDFSQDDTEALFEALDTEGNGAIDFVIFLEILRPTMSPSRMDIIEKAFKKADRDGDGFITVEDLRGVYKATDHPQFQKGDLTEEQVFQEFLKTFESPNESDGKVSREEFVNYYLGLSAVIDDDTYFNQMMRKAWKI